MGDKFESATTKTTQICLQQDPPEEKTPPQKKTQTHPYLHIHYQLKPRIL